MSTKTKTILAALGFATLMTSAAHAGGFSRGTADTDILFEQGTFVTRFGATYVSPTQNVNIGTPGTPGPAGSFDNTPSYFVPSAAMKLQVTDALGCAGTFTTPFGGDVDYSGSFLGYDTDSLATTSQSFVTNELGLTCGYGIDVGPGRAYLIGGVFMQTLDFEQNVLGNIAPGGAGVFELSDTGFGYRIGAAYEIPEIALRAQLLYRSAVSVDAEGSFTSVIGNNPFAVGTATFPQSVELKVQSGVAPGWLVFGSAKWTDWSSFDTLDYVALTPSALVFNYSDGWTVTAGVAHRFNEQFAASASVTWDQGVGTGFDLNGADVYTIAVGGSYTPSEMVEVRAGLGVSFFGGDSQDFRDIGGGNSLPIAGYKTSSSGNAIGGSFSAKIKF